VFTALLDTCVLWPSLQRDFLLSLAAEGMYRPAWSSAILEELELHEARKLVQREVDASEAESRAAHLIDRMRQAFDDAEIQGWEGLEGTYRLPDPDDEHVVAAAVVGGAGAIVTHNLKDFPSERLPHHLALLTPAEFALNTVALDPRRALTAVREIAQRSGHRGPRLQVDDILRVLVDRYGLVEAVDLLRSAD